MLAVLSLAEPALKIVEKEKKNWSRKANIRCQRARPTRAQTVCFIICFGVDPLHDSDSYGTEAAAVQRKMWCARRRVCLFAFA